MEKDSCGLWDVRQKNSYPVSRGIILLKEAE